MQLRAHVGGNETARAVTLWKVIVAVVIIGLVASQASTAVSEKRTEVNSGTILPAHIRPIRLLSLSRSFPAVVTSVLVAPGDTVNAGQVLAQLENPEIAAALERAKTRWQRAEERWNAHAQSGHLESGSSIYEEQYHAASRALEVAKSRLEQNSVASLEQTHARLVAQTHQIEQLVAEQLATGEELARSQSQTQDAWQAIQAAREHISRLRQEAEAAASQQRIAQLQLNLNGKAEEESARHEYEEAQAGLLAAQRRASELTMIAEGAGTVVSPAILTGDRWPEGRALFEIADLSRLRVEVPVAAKIARQVKKGNRVLVRMPIDPPREIEATITEILLVPDGGAQSYTIQVTIPNPDPHVILTGLDAAVVFPHVRKDSFSWARLPF